MENKGFSLIEVIAAVAILAIISGPILKSFTTASVTNSRAQVTQDATSLSEEIMEKVKSTSIEDLYKESTGEIEGKIGTNVIDSSRTTFKFGEEGIESEEFLKTPPFNITYDDITATQGKTFNAVVNISTDEYSAVSEDENVEIADASDANTFEVPDLKGVDSSKHLILSWEINGYDESAVDRLVDENAIEMTERSTICAKAASDGRKTTRIEVTPVTEGSDSYIKTECYVSYEIPGYPNSVEFLAYTGTLPEVTEEGASGPNIYLFYSTTRGAGSSECFRYEDIVINDGTSGHNHNVFVILQNGLSGFKDNNSTPTIDIDLSIKENGTQVVSGVSTLTGNITPLSASGTKLYTNAIYGLADSNMFDKKAKDRIYYVTVSVLRDGTTYSTLTSTMDTGAEADK